LVTRPLRSTGITPLQRYYEAVRPSPALATKDDVRAIIGEELSPIHAELRSIRRDLDELMEKVENVSRFRKEIDHALERIASIEKHLGIDKKIAA
jgi:hypothetical protein